MSERGDGSPQPRPLSPMVLHGIAHECNAVLQQGRVYICTPGTMPPAHLGAFWWMVPDNIVITNDAPTMCPKCGLPARYATFGSTEWN